MCLSSRRRATLLVLCLASSALPTLAVHPLAAQRRTLQSGEPETQVLGYYSALMSFRPVGLPDRGRRLFVGGSATFIPDLSATDRTVSFGGTKTVNTNFCPAFPRLTSSLLFGRVGVELDATPPVTMCGVEASVIGAAISYRAPLSPSWDGLVRVSGIGGTVKAPITCSEDEVANPINQTCYGGSVSHDRMAPFAVQADVVAAWRGWTSRRIEPYLSAGVRYERVNFDVNYTRDTTQANTTSALDPTHAVPALFDHERLRATLSRVHLAAGATWEALGRLRLGGELLYAPGAVLTFSGSLGFLLGRSR